MIVVLNPGGWPVATPLQLDPAYWQLATQVKDLHLREESWPVGAPVGPASFQPTLGELLVLSGLLTTPATTLNALTAWAFLVEALESVEPGAGFLKTVAATRGWDSTVKASFSWKMAHGPAAWLLMHQYGVVHVADAEPFINRAMLAAGPFGGVGLHQAVGNLQKPDFLCLTAAGEVVIAEVKGAFGPPSNLSGPKAKGKRQTQAVTPIGAPLRASLGRLVFATNVRIDGKRVHSGKESGTAVVDPEGDDQALNVPVDADDVVRAAYQKVFNLAGRRELAALLETPRPEVVFFGDGAELGTQEVHGTRAVPLIDIGPVRLFLQRGVFDALFGGPQEGIAQRVQATLDETGGHLSEVGGVMRQQGLGFGLPNGVLVAAQGTFE